MVQREGERRRGRPRHEGGGEGTAAGKRRKYSTKWSTLARDEYQRAQQGSGGARFERGEGGGVT